MKSKVYAGEIRLLAGAQLRQKLEQAARQRDTTISELARTILSDGLRRLTDRGNPPASPDLAAAA